jgi:hypothetical protein
VSDLSSSAPPSLATGPVLWLVLVLLAAALGLDMVLSPHWTDPLGEPGTWVLFGVLTGAVLRHFGQRRARKGAEDGQEDGRRLRRLSLLVWGLSALGGLVSLFL